MKILALDSSTEACSVALLTDQQVHEKFEVIGRGHAEHLLPMIDSLLKEQQTDLDQIDLFAYGAGPGSFTGLRIGAAMMQGLALARDRQLVAVSSLAALALRHQGLVLSAIDARMDQIYSALYRNDDTVTLVKVSDITVSSPGEVMLPENGAIIVCGSGWDRYKNEFIRMGNSERKITGRNDEYPHAAEIARLAILESQHGRRTDPAEALPHYVRNNVARKMAER